ncbi:DUF3775 domain-containing protein [Glacieibacterium frigidum]|uniref:DUF3775 domain-containing protein n=1 Tax=Glacieibacterium frigidum TaxID=2593303 RepID=A0A552UJ65_9SPHN|nr:DUF3775 domain-containing protein [Glacieibacterium frigidum]TRW18225.1 DUF3775 domain-containing protein [Glacieibacterium frigidum]
MELTIPLDTVCRIVLRAREFEALIPDTDPDDGSNASDDGAVGELEDDGDNPTEEELRAIIDDLADDEQAELIALAWVGRGTYDATEWDDAISTAADEVDDTADYLLDLPMLAAYLEAGLAAFELSCDGQGQVV